MIRRLDTGAMAPIVGAFLLILVIIGSQLSYDSLVSAADHQEHLYFPSGRFLTEAAVGYREAVADYLWFRFIQYYGAFAKGHNDLRYFDLLIDGITKLDPRFVEAYHFASLVAWSDLGSFPKSLDLLKRGILNNPDKAKLPFQVGFTYYVFYKEYHRASFWFKTAAKCSDATDRERRFAAFAEHRAGDDLVSLELWKSLLNSTDNPQMVELAVKMIKELTAKIKAAPQTSLNIQGPLPEVH